MLSFAFSTTIGLKCKDGVVLGMEKVLHSKLLKRGANRRIMSADLHIGIVKYREEAMAMHVLIPIFY